MNAQLNPKYCRITECYESCDSEDSNDHAFIRPEQIMSKRFFNHSGFIRDSLVCVVDKKENIYTRDYLNKGVHDVMPTAADLPADLLPHITRDCAIYMYSPDIFQIVSAINNEILDRAYIMSVNYSDDCITERGAEPRGLVDIIVC